MAAINTQTPNTRQKGFIRKYTLHRHRIDMTPMVDLGFLLITFFVFTATLSTPATMNLFMPKDGPVTNVSDFGALTILISNNSAIKYYEGLLKPNAGNVKNSSVKDIRAVIANKKAAAANYIFDAACEEQAKVKGVSADNCKQQKLTILIKPGNDASYKDIVAILDEMTINKIAHYALVEPDAADVALFK